MLATLAPLGLVRKGVARVDRRRAAPFYFSKTCGLDPAEMVSSSIVFKALRNFRAGVEACISFLKRSFGMGRCTWSGPASFRAYVWSAVVAANALLLARHRLAST